MPRPSSWYNFRTWGKVSGKKFEILIDTGAAANVVSEETVVRLINMAISRGITPDQEGWLIYALEEWGSEEEATGVSRNAPLRNTGCVVLKLVLEELDNRTVTQLFRFKIFASSLLGGLLGTGSPLEDHLPGARPGGTGLPAVSSRACL